LEWAVKLIDRLKELYDRDFPSDATEENNEEYRELMHGLLLMFPQLVAVVETAKQANDLGFKMTNGKTAYEPFENAMWVINNSDDGSIGCEKCGHDEFDTVHSSGDPDPGYRCKKCGYIEWI
jgi:predicted nucleic-acid-binding Zn-ribbon protein